MPPDLRDLVEALGWTIRASEAMRSWNERYEDLLATRLREAEASHPSFATIAQGYQLLDGPDQRRFLQSPRVAAALLAGDRARPGVGVISSELRDALCRSAPEEEAAPAPGDGASLLTTLTIPGVGSDRLTVDCGGDFPTRAGDSGLLSALTREQARLSDEKLQRAAALVAAVSRPAAAFLACFTHRLALRADPLDETGFRSGSLAGYPGLTILVNPHADRGSIEVLAEALVHEAIHAAIYTLEEIVAPLLSVPASDAIRLSSPWTGASLTIDSYVQACFVWYGLYRFWDRALFASVVEPRRAEPLRDRARRGFLEQPVTRGLGSHRETYLSERALDALLRVEAAVADGRSVEAE